MASSRAESSPPAPLPQRSSAQRGIHVGAGSAREEAITDTHHHQARKNQSFARTAGSASLPSRVFTPSSHFSSTAGLAFSQACAA